MQKIALLMLLIYSSHALANTAPAAEPANAAAKQAVATSAAPATAQPTEQNSQPAPNAVPANPHDKSAPSLEQIAAPNDSTLSKANAELLVKNAELERKIDELSTQVNVLTHERSGQLFLYGALTVLVTIGLCVLAGALITMRSQRSRW